MPSGMPLPCLLVETCSRGHRGGGTGKVWKTAEGRCNCMKKKSRGGRPRGTTKLTREIIASLKQSLRNGCTIKEACRTADVSYSSFRRWRIIAGNKRRGVFQEFNKEIGAIFAEREARWREYCRQVIAKELARLEKRKQQILAYNQRILAYRRRRSF